jgi:glycosyltransferase involved in cell wall biosynthesis
VNSASTGTSSNLLRVAARAGPWAIGVTWRLICGAFWARQVAVVLTDAGAALRTTSDRRANARWLRDLGARLPRPTRPSAMGHGEMVQAPPQPIGNIQAGFGFAGNGPVDRDPLDTHDDVGSHAEGIPSKLPSVSSDFRPIVLVVSPAFPTLDQLATELARRQLLSVVVHPFLILDDRLFGIAGRVPWVGSWLVRELRRRSRPGALPQRHVVLAGTRWDLLQAALAKMTRRVPRPLRQQFAAAHYWAIWKRNSVLAHEASRRVSDVDVVVASFGTGLPAFQSAPTGVLRCLDYPTALWDVAREMLSEEARANPEFAGTIENMTISARTQALVRSEVEAADVILVGSEFARQTFIMAGIPPERLLVATYGVDTELFVPDSVSCSSSQAFTALFAGSIGQRKGISYLLDAWAIFLHSHVRDDARLLLAGSFVGNPAPVLQRAALFEHLPHRPLAELPKIFRAASVFVLPSIVEGMPLVVLEAMACGVPCIVTPNGPADVVRDGVDGFVVPIRDPAAIADRLQRLAEDPELRQQMSRNARARALEYTWASYTDRVLAGLRAKLDGCNDHGLLPTMRLPTRATREDGVEIERES